MQISFTAMVLVLCQAVLIAASSAVAAHPNDSIGRERVPPTPYGHRLERTGEGPAILTGPFSNPFGNPHAETPDIGVDRASYMAAIESAEESLGAYSAGLVEPLASVGRAFQMEQDHGEAMDYFRRALHLSRVNEGLYSANQLPILNNMIASQLALGNLLAADEIQHYRYRVQKEALADDPKAMMAATDDYIEWQHQLYLAKFGDDTFRRLLRMHTLQSDIIEQLETEQESLPQLLSYLYQRLGSEYLLADYQGEKQPGLQVSIGRSSQAGPNIMSTDLEQQEFRMIKNNAFRSGVKTLKRIVALTESQDPPLVEEVARARIALGDWYLWWDWEARALQNYEEAYRLYASDDNPNTDPTELFKEPVELPQDPVFRPMITTTSDRSDARAKVSLSISRLGEARDIEILELDAEDQLGARVTLHKMLKEVRYRPVVVDGEVVTASSVVREYKFDH